MEVPSPAGRAWCSELEVEVGDSGLRGLAAPDAGGRAASGDGAAPAEAPATRGRRRPPPPRRRRACPRRRARGDDHAQVVVLGGGPGGYTAAFRAADLGLETVLVERYAKLGGVCLNVGCIPSKALLHIARRDRRGRGGRRAAISFGEPEIDLDALRSWKETVVGRLTGGLDGLAKQRKVEVVTRRPRSSPGRTLLEVDGATGRRPSPSTTASSPRARSAAPAAGLSRGRPAGHGLDRRARARGGPRAPAGDRRRHHRPRDGDGLRRARLRGHRGRDARRAASPAATPTWCGRCRSASQAATRRSTSARKVAEVKARDDGLHVTFDGDDAPEPAALSTASWSRSAAAPTAAEIGAEDAGVEVDERGFIAVDEQMRTNVAHIHAIGDIVGEPMLAHKASHEGEGRRRGDRRPGRRLRRARDPLGRLHRPRGRLDGAHRDRGRRRDGIDVREGELPVGRVRPRALARARPRA